MPATTQRLPGDAQPPLRRGPARRALLGGLLYCVMLLGALVLLRAQGTTMAQAVAALRQIDLPLLGLALGAEALRFGAVGLLLWQLAALLGVQTSLGSSLRLTMLAVAARHLVPLGGIPDYALRVRFLSRRGAPAGTITAYLLLDSLLSWLALITVFALGLGGYLAAYRQLPPQPLLFGVAAGCTLLALGLLGWLWIDELPAVRLVGWLGRNTQRLPTWRGRRLLPAPELLEGLVADLRFGLARARGRRFLRLVGIALLAPLADIAALAALFAALGQQVDPATMLLGYGLAGYLAFLTPLPGDTGVVEAALTLVFTLLGYDLAIVVVGVLLFRLISFWLPIPLGLLAAWGNKENL